MIQVDRFETLCLRVQLPAFKLQSEKFAKRTLDKSVCCAVTVFRNWRAQRNAVM